MCFVAPFNQNPRASAEKAVDIGLFRPTITGSQGTVRDTADLVAETTPVAGGSSRKKSTSTTAKKRATSTGSSGVKDTLLTSTAGFAKKTLLGT